MIRFEGTTDPGCAVTASGKYAAEVDTHGNWWVVLVLNPGGNLVSVTADDHRGHVTEVGVPVFYDPPLVLRPDGLGLVKFGDPVEQGLQTGIEGVRAIISKMSRLSPSLRALKMRGITGK